jgi:hypothetical protein
MRAISRSGSAILFAGFGRGEAGLCQKHQVALVWPTPAPEICSVKHWRHHNKENKGHRRLLRADCAARILRIGICWSQRKRGSAGNTTASHKNRKENVLRCRVRLPYPAALRLERCNVPQREGDITLWYAEANAVSKTSV